MKIPSLEELEEFCFSLGLDKTDGEYLHCHWTDNGFKRGTKRIKDWKACVRAWKIQGYLPSQREAFRTRFTADRRHDNRRGEPGRRKKLSDLLGKEPF